ncbi:MAG TPA: tripartite tricarboxylate transporter substrate-binding protein [Ramlibacter sp.]|nr:tripartite tricarboxylate transporter substrate-binding protein [Ramlibacter sp.]
MTTLFPPSLRRASSAALACLLLAAAAGSHAQTAGFPNRPIRIIVSSSAGGFTDAVTRTVAKHMAENIGQAVVVENRPGAGTLIGMSACAKAPPDGYTLCLTDNQSLVYNPLLFTKLPYDPRGDFVGVGGVVRSAGDIIVAHPSAPVSSFQELVSYARSHPNALSFATWGPGSIPAIHYAWITRQNNVQITAVPYKGAAPSFLAVNAGEVNLAYSSVVLAKPAIDAGKVKPIAVTGTRRVPSLPNVPALGEFNSDPGLPTFWGLYAPAKTPPAVVARLNAELNKVLRMPVFQDYANTSGMQPMDGSVEEFAGYLAQSQATAARTFQAIGIKPVEAPTDAPATAPAPQR